jgi:hypothetical protein
MRVLLRINSDVDQPDPDILSPTRWGSGCQGNAQIISLIFRMVNILSILVGMKRVVLVLFLIFHLSIGVNAQSFLTPSDSLSKPRVISVSAGTAGLWAGSIAGLGLVWYADFEKTKFHFFDDSREWQQMDKLGHFYAAGHFAEAVGDAYKWAGVAPKKASLIGTAVGLGYLTTFEILDAYSADWGFSWADMGCNALGVASYFGQSYFFDERFVNFKFSAQPTGLADYRPEVLGNSFASKLLKDYNGQTYWMSFNPFCWGKKGQKIPKWLNLSFGYGINNQLIGDGGIYVIDNGTSQLSFTPYREFYFSLDIDFEKIPTRSKFLKLLFKGLNTLKVPFPAMEFSTQGIRFRPFYF